MHRSFHFSAPLLSVLFHTNTKKVLTTETLHRKENNEKKMFNIDEEKKECTWQHEFFFGRARKPRVFFSDVGFCGIFLSLTLGTANFKQLD